MSKLYKIDHGSGYNFTYLIGNLNKKTLKSVGKEFTEKFPEIDIDIWSEKFVKYLKTVYKLKQIIKVESIRPQQVGVNYAR